MRAIVLDAPGGPDQMRLRDVPMPEASPGRVLVRVRACGVSHRDVIERRGHPRMRTPIVQGHEFAGEVVEIGPGVEGFRPGDRVVSLYTDSCGACAACQRDDERCCEAPSEAYGLTVDGGYAEYVAVRERGLEALPDGISWEEGAVVMGTAGVAYNNVVYNAAVHADEDVLVTGASGGVGSAAVRAARHVGAKVWAVTSSADKVEALEALGAHHVLVDRDGSFPDEVRRGRARGVDAVIDCVGVPTLSASLRAVRRFGRVVAIGTVGGPRLDLSLGRLVVHSIKLLGSENVSRGVLREVLQLVAEGRLGVTVDARLPLSQAAEAHRRIESRGVTGRLVLVPEHG